MCAGIATSSERGRTGPRFRRSLHEMPMTSTRRIASDAPHTRMRPGRLVLCALLFAAPTGCAPSSDATADATGGTTVAPNVGGTGGASASGGAPGTGGALVGTGGAFFWNGGSTTDTSTGGSNSGSGGSTTGGTSSGGAAVGTGGASVAQGGKSGGGGGKVGGGSGGTPATDGGTGGATGPIGGATSPGCAGKAYKLCEDFETGTSGAIPTGWTAF